MSESSAGHLTNERLLSPPSPTTKAQFRGGKEAPSQAPLLPDFYPCARNKVRTGFAKRQSTAGDQVRTARRSENAPSRRPRPPYR